MNVIEMTKSSGRSFAKADFKDRMAKLKQLAKDGGIRLPATRLPEGTQLWDVGRENQRAMAQTIKDLPFFADAAEGMLARIDSEDCIDTPEVVIQQVRMSSKHAGLFAMGKKEDNALGYTRAALNHIGGFIKPAGVADFVGNLLSIQDPKLRSQVFNYHAERKSESDKVRIRTFVPDAEAGERVIRAIVSSKHSLTTGDDRMVIGAMTTQMGDILSHAKARFTRDLNRSEFEVIWPAMDRQLQVGDIAYIGARVVNSETKASALRVEAFVHRVLCANFTTMDSEDLDADELSVKHIGDLTRKLPMLFQRALSRAEPFVKAFADAYQNEFPKTLPTRGEVLARVQKKLQLTESTVNLAGQVWDADGSKSAGNTLAGLVNALTRASQSMSMTQAGDVETVAGQLVTGGWKLLAA